MQQVATATSNPGLYPVHIADEATSFTANGQTYLVNATNQLSVVRAQWLEKYGLWSVLGRDAAAYLGEAKRALDALNKSKPADASIILFNMMRGLEQLDKASSPILLICALFMNREGEDITDYSEELAIQKITDWEKEGIEMDYFKKKAYSFVSVTSEDLSDIIRTFSNQLPELSLKSPITSTN